MKNGEWRNPSNEPSNELSKSRIQYELEAILPHPSGKGLTSFTWLISRYLRVYKKVYKSFTGGVTGKFLICDFSKFDLGRTEEHREARISENP